MYTAGYKEYKENSDLNPVISPKNFVVKKNNHELQMVIYAWHK